MKLSVRIVQMFTYTTIYVINNVLPKHMQLMVNVLIVFYHVKLAHLSLVVNHVPKT